VLWREREAGQAPFAEIGQYVRGVRVRPGQFSRPGFDPVGDDGSDLLARIACGLGKWESPWRHHGPRPENLPGGPDARTPIGRGYRTG
jgi:hypothetical protein